MIKDAPEHYEGPYRGRAATPHEHCPQCDQPRPTYRDYAGARRYKRHCQVGSTDLCGLSRQPVR